MRIVVAGGAGFLGVPLCAALLAAGHEVTVLTRRADSARGRLPSGVALAEWDARSNGAGLTHGDAADAVVNLAGAGIADGRWTPERKAVLRSSRLDATSALIAAIQQASVRPKVLVTASAIGYYGDTGDDIVNESRGAGSDFLARLCADWEAAARPAEALGTRVVFARIGIVLARDGGALAKLTPAFRAFVGGPLGSGRQWYSWIHRDDVIGLLRFAIEHDDLAGPLNVTAPQPARMRELATTLGAVLHRPALLPVPTFALRILVGELAETLVTGQRVLPVVAREHGYDFLHPTLAAALQAAVT